MSQSKPKGYEAYDPEATETTEEAHKILKARRAEYIAIARDIADEIIWLEGSATTNRVYKLMQERGLIDPAIKGHWIATVFSGDRERYKPTGELGNGTNIRTHTQRNDVIVWTWTEEYRRQKEAEYQ